jgi:hypothetical protein
MRTGAVQRAPYVGACTPGEARGGETDGRGPSVSANLLNAAVRRLTGGSILSGRRARGGGYSGPRGVFLQLGRKHDLGPFKRFYLFYFISFSPFPNSNSNLNLNLISVTNLSPN